MDVCGTDPVYPNERVVGGDDVDQTRVWPWMGFMHTETGTNFCSVVLISWRWATTAAHCV